MIGQRFHLSPPSVLGGYALPAIGAALVVAAIFLGPNIVELRRDRGAASAARSGERRLDDSIGNRGPGGGLLRGCRTPSSI